MNWIEFWNTILGGLSKEQALAYFILMAAGAFVNFAFSVGRSVRKDSRTPRKFSFWFLIRDNILRGLGVLIFMVVLLLYFEDFFDVALNGKMAFVFGYTIDTIIGSAVKDGKNIGVLKRSREKLIKKYS